MKLTTVCQDCIDCSLTFDDFLSVAMNIVYERVDDSISFTNAYIRNNEEITRLKNELLHDLEERFYMGHPLYLEAKDRINEVVRSLDLEDDDEKQSVAVLYGIMQAIDRGYNYVDNHVNTLGPLDSDESHRFRVYKKFPEDPLNQDFLNWVSRDDPDSKSLIYSLSNFMFIDTNKWEPRIMGGLPRGIIVNPADTSSKEHPIKRKLKIGISPFCSERNFEFNTDKEDKEGYFTVEYHDDQEKYCLMAKEVLNKAITNECDFLILPEYHSSPEVTETISSVLEQAYNDGKCTPILTFAGTQWTKENNNVLSVFSKSGVKVGEYYKACNYRGEGKPTEKLENPGEQCIYFAIKNVGTILPSVCKDIINKDYTRVLAMELKPLLIFISAWSNSVASFDAVLDYLGSDFKVNSVFANACSAVNKKKKTIGHCRVSTKPKTTPKAKKEGIKRKTNCHDCSSGCLRIAEYCFGYYDDNDQFVKPSLEVY